MRVRFHLLNIFLPLFFISFSWALENEKLFYGEGKAKQFTEAKESAYIDVVRNALIYAIGENQYNQYNPQLGEEFLTYFNVRKYIVGETEDAPKEKRKKWVSNYRDSDGKLVLKLQAFVKVTELKNDFEIWKSKLSSKSSESSKFSELPKENTTTSLDYSNVDISSITMLIYYNPKAPLIVNNPEEETYAKWAVDNLNREVASMGIQVFDIETMEKLSKEREVLQEAESGNVGIGLLLAQKVFAELYAEILPVVTYQGTKAHAILNVKVFVRTTGALIATIEKGGQMYDSPSLHASIKASMREAAQKVRDALKIELKKYVANGRFYFLRLIGVDSYNQASTFAKQLKKIENVVSVKLKSGSKEDKTYDYDLQYKGNPTELIDIIMDTLPQKPGFESLDLKQIRGNEIIFSID